MKGVEASPINYPQIGVPESHHIRGRVRGGRHLAQPNPTPIANLIAGIGAVAGLELDGIEHTTGKVTLI